VPYETRRIAFSDDELFHAVDLFGRDHPLELPDGALVAVRIHEGRIEATLRPSRKSPARTVATFAPAMAVRILVHFCLDEKIPLPRHADKTFSIENGRAALMVEVVTGRAAKAARLIETHGRHHDRAARPGGAKGASEARAEERAA
jgi:hypothetical protein